MTAQNADNASQADGLMRQTNQVVDQAGHSMTELRQAMERDQRRFATKPPRSSRPSTRSPSRPTFWP
jgi:hypothetical protein